MTLPELFEGLVNESKDGSVTIPMPTVTTTEQALAEQQYYQREVPGLVFAVRETMGTWYLLVSKKAARVVRFD